MKTELKAKYLHFLLGKKKNRNEGFTLIELLVVVIIIGILSAIALPNFLNQSAKAKQSEAKNTVNAVNTAQNTYRQENTTFAAGATAKDAMDALALGLPTSTANYTYTFTAADATLSVITAARQDNALKGYVGAVEQYKNANSESVISSVICEAKTPGNDVATAPTTGQPQNSACGSDVEMGQK